MNNNENIIPQSSQINNNNQSIISQHNIENIISQSSQIIILEISFDKEFQKNNINKNYKSNENIQEHYNVNQNTPSLSQIRNIYYKPKEDIQQHNDNVDQDTPCLTQLISTIYEGNYINLDDDKYECKIHPLGLKFIIFIL